MRWLIQPLQLLKKICHYFSSSILNTAHKIMLNSLHLNFKGTLFTIIKLAPPYISTLTQDMSKHLKIKSILFVQSFKVTLDTIVLLIIITLSIHLALIRSLVQMMFLWSKKVWDIGHLFSMNWILQPAWNIILTIVKCHINYTEIL